MTATIAIEMSAGTAIETASKDAQRIAELLGINCEFHFNDVKCLAIPGGSASLLAELQQHQQARKLDRPSDYRFCTSRVDLGDAA